MTVDLPASVDRALVARLRESFAGPLVQPGDATYEVDRLVWNGSIDRRPALIARCTGVADVMAAVRWARDTDLPLAVRSGGHSFPGLSVCDGGVVIDLGGMKGVRVDLAAGTARAQAGTVLGELDRETQAFGMAVPAGIVTSTGLAGLTLGGGIGWLMRRYGLTIDQLVSVDLVTAEGRLVRASEDENPELFWGVRGGGGNFGIVTSFEYRLNPVGPTVLAGPIVWAMEDSPLVLRHYRDWITTVPDELTTIVVHRKLPPAPAIPPELHGRQVVMVGCCYAGPLEKGDAVIAPMRAFGQPLLDLCQPRAFVQFQAMFDASFPPGWWYYFRACDLAELSDPVIDTVAEHALRMQSPLTAFPIFQMGGAVARVGPNDTAYAGRQSGHVLNINVTTATEERFAEEREWARTFWSALEPYHLSVYVNFLMDEGEDRIRQAYGPTKYDRLKALKRQWDPDNLFRLNQNIPPG